MPTFFSFFYGYFLKKSWLSNSLMFSRFYGTFCRHESKKFLPSSDISTYDGITTLSFIIFTNSSSFVILNGFSPTIISYIITPNDQISIFSSYSFPFKIYGQTYRGVPQNVFLMLSSLWTDHPKSHNFITFYFYHIFYVMQNDVLRLYIPMNDPIWVKFVDSLTYLPHNSCHFLFRHALMFFQLLE